jgi:uncharacterized protein YjbJ (UPF0337 family)
MLNAQMLEGHWNQIKGKLRQRWGQLSENDFTEFHGDVDELVGIIQRKTGESREAIGEYLDQLTRGMGQTIEAAAEAVRGYAQQAAENVQSAASRAAEQFRGGYAEAQRHVRERPMESLAVCFGAGLITGVLLGLLLRSR